MRKPLTREFVESFVETCMDMGLTKEATAELLQHRSAIHAAEQSPAFAEGYSAMRDEMPTGTAVMVRPGYVEKSANAGKAFSTLIGGLGGIARGAGGLLSAAGRGAVNVASHNPRTTKALAGAATAGGFGYGLSQVLNNRYKPQGAPYLPGTGSYNPETEKQEYANQLDRYSAGIADTNKAINDSADRRKVLQQAVDSNSPHSAQALSELRMLNARADSARGTRQRFLEQLNADGAVTSKRLQDIQARQKQLQERRNSPFWRGLHRLTFRNPDKSYDAALSELQGPAAELSRQNQLINDQRERLPYWEGHKYNQPSATQMQREFFPTS